jgi:hypothetical protein
MLFVTELLYSKNLPAGDAGWLLMFQGTKIKITDYHFKYADISGYLTYFELKWPLINGIFTQEIRILLRQVNLSRANRFFALSMTECLAIPEPSDCCFGLKTGM